LHGRINGKKGKNVGTEDAGREVILHPEPARPNIGKALDR